VEGGTGSQRQREIYKESGNFLDVVAFLIEGTRPAPLFSARGSNADGT